MLYTAHTNKVGQAAAPHTDHSCRALKTLKKQTHTGGRYEENTLPYRWIKWTFSWLVDGIKKNKMKEKVLTHFFFFFGILQNSLNSLRVLFPWQQGLGLCLRVYVCPARPVAFFWCSQAPSCARGFRGQQHRLKHSAVGLFSASLHCQSVRNHTRHTYTLYNTWFTHVDTHDTCNCCKQLARLGNVPAYFLGFTLRFLFFPSLINAAAAAASFCPASCLHAAASNLKAEQHLSHPVSYHSLLSIASLAFSLSPFLPPSLT